MSRSSRWLALGATLAAGLLPAAPLHAAGAKPPTPLLSPGSTGVAEAMNDAGQIAGTDGRPLL